MGLAKESFHVRKNVDCFDLPLSFCEVFFRSDYEDLSLSENELDYMSDLETLERYWEIVSKAQLPRLKEVTPLSPFSNLPY